MLTFRKSQTQLQDELETRKLACFALAIWQVIRLNLGLEWITEDVAHMIYVYAKLVRQTPKAICIKGEKNGGIIWLPKIALKAVGEGYIVKEWFSADDQQSAWFKANRSEHV